MSWIVLFLILGGGLFWFIKSHAPTASHQRRGASTSSDSGGDVGSSIASGTVSGAHHSDVSHCSSDSGGGCDGGGGGGGD